MLGTDVCDTFVSAGHEVIPVDIVGDVIKLDIIDTREVMRAVREHKPELVIHCAAYTNVDGCESHRDDAFRLNGIGTWNVAAAAKESDAAMLYVSTDFVFDGEKGEPYTEYDQPNPLSCYGESKYAGEMHVRSICNKHYIVRTAWLYGNRGKNFPTTILTRAEAGDHIRVVSDQYGSPTYTVDLAAFLLSLAGSPLYGTYHATNSGSCSWFELARKVLDLAGKSDYPVTPIQTKDWASPTRRPRDSRLRHYVLELMGKDDFRSWEEALAEFVEKWITAKQ